MEATTPKSEAAAKSAVPAEGEQKKKRSFGSAFMNFLAMGGIIIVVIAGLAIAILISILTK